MLLEGEPATGSRATGVEYRTADGATAVVDADKEVVLSAGAIGSPHLLLLSGIGPRAELEAVGVAVPARLARRRQAPQGPPAASPWSSRRPGVGVSMTEVGISMGPDALRAPAGPLPADPADDAALPPELQASRPRPSGG